MIERSHEEHLQNLLDATGKVLEAAYVDEAAARDAIKALEQARQRIEQRLNALARHVEGVIGQSAESTATEAARLLQEKFVAADEAADAAANRYREAARWIGWKMVGAAALVLLIAIAGAWFIAQRALPSQAEADRLRADIEQLRAQAAFEKQQVDVLERKGGGLQLHTCRAENGTHHLCFRTNETSYRGPFETSKAGETYRIPLGY